MAAGILFFQHNYSGKRRVLPGVNGSMISNYWSLLFLMICVDGSRTTSFRANNRSVMNCTDPPGLNANLRNPVACGVNRVTARVMKLLFLQFLRVKNFPCKGRYLGDRPHPTVLDSPPLPSLDRRAPEHCLRRQSHSCAAAPPPLQRIEEPRTL